MIAVTSNSGMDAAMESQVVRILDAFRKAANKHWGSEDPQKSRGPEKRTRGNPAKPGKPRSWIKGRETETQKQVREYLEQNPGGSALEASKATGVSYSVCKSVKAKLEKAKGTA